MKWLICASGPSMSGVDMAALRRFRSWRVMVVNNTWELAPWADVLYAGDRQWWDRYGKAAEAFRGQRWTRDKHSAIRCRAKHVVGIAGNHLCKEPGKVCCGGNSGFQAINLTYHLGAKRIVLLGYDMHRRDGGHWHGEHEGMLSAPEDRVRTWPANFVPLAADLAFAGVDVVNATPGTALHAFRKAPLAEALRC